MYVLCSHYTILSTQRHILRVVFVSGTTGIFFVLFGPRNRYQFLFSTNVILLAAFLSRSSLITFKTPSTYRFCFFLLPSLLSFFLSFSLFFLFISHFLCSLACFVVFFLSFLLSLFQFFPSFFILFRSYLSFFMVWRDHITCISLRVSTMKNQHGF